MPDEIKKYDAKMHPRCRQLGSEIHFGYCRVMNNGLPCNQVLNCWYHLFDIETFIVEHYTEEEIKTFLKGQSRLAIILEAVKKYS